MTDETLEEWLAAQAREGAGEDPSEHPSVESISSYHARELSADESEQVQQHLAACHECTRFLLALSDALTEVPRSVEAADGLDAEEDWRKLRARIEENHEPPVQTTPYPRQTTRRWRATTYALAALLCFALIGLSIHALRQSLGTTTKSGPIFVSSASMARSVDLVKKIEVDPRNETELNLVLEAPTGNSFPGYGLEVRDSQGKTVLRRGTVVRHPDGFIFTVSPGVLTEGRFEIQVQGLQDSSSTIVGRYWIEIDHR